MQHVVLGLLAPGRAITARPVTPRRSAPRRAGLGRSKARPRRASSLAGAGGGRAGPGRTGLRSRPACGRRRVRPCGPLGERPLVIVHLRPVRLGMPEKDNPAGVLRRSWVPASHETGAQGADDAYSRLTGAVSGAERCQGKHEFWRARVMWAGSGHPPRPARRDGVRISRSRRHLARRLAARLGPPGRWPDVDATGDRPGGVRVCVGADIGASVVRGLLRPCRRRSRRSLSRRWTRAPPTHPVISTTLPDAG